MKRTLKASLKDSIFWIERSRAVDDESSRGDATRVCLGLTADEPAVRRSVGTRGNRAFRTTEDVADVFGVTSGTICKWVAAGKITGAEKRGRAWWFDLAEIRRLRDSKDLTWLNGQDR